MQRLPKQLAGNLQLGTSISTLYTVPANTRTTIAAAALNNTSATPRTVTLHLVPSGGSATTANQIITTVTVPAAGAQPTQLPAIVGQILEAGGTIQALAEAATCITPLISGYETTLS